MSVTAHNFIGQNNSSTPAEVISNLFVSDMQSRTAKPLTDDTYNTSIGTNLVRIKAVLDTWGAANPGMSINKDIWTILQRPVYGVLISDFTYSLQSEWEAVQLPAILDMRSFADLAVIDGHGEIGAVTRTQKYWKRSGDIKISPTFRILDVDGDGRALHYVNMLLLMSTSVASKEMVTNGNQMLTDASSLVLGATESIKNVMGFDKTSPLGSFAENYIDISGKAISKLIANATDYNTLRSAPPPVDVQIGKIFSHQDMVITDVSVVFSKECTEAGPIYADVTLQLASRKIIEDINSVGLAGKGLMAVDATPNIYTLNYETTKEPTPDAVTGADKRVKDPREIRADIEAKRENLKHRP